ncbi:MAG: ABC transporter ATP-binding protein [Brevinema sp.]
MVVFNHVSHDYGNFRALHDVSFSIKEGALLALLGPNGAGKSTIMGIMTGIRTPAEGTVTVSDIDIFDKPEEAKAKIGYLGEIPPLYPELTVWEYLIFAARLQNVARPEARTVEILELLKITDRRDSLIKNLSKGLKQRVGIAQSIIHSPKLLVLDEPTVGLEPSQLIEFRTLIRNLAKSENMTVVLSTHIMQEAAELCDEILIINEGRIIFEGSQKDLLTQENALVYKVEADDLGLLKEKLEGQDFVSHIDKKDDALIISCTRPAAEEIASLMLKSKCGFQSLTKTKSSLEEVFLNLTKGAQ